MVRFITFNMDSCCLTFFTFRHHIVWFTCLLPRQRDAHGVRNREEAMVLPRSGILVQEEKVRRIDKVIEVMGNLITM